MDHPLQRDAHTWSHEKSAASPVSALSVLRYSLWFHVCLLFRIWHSAFQLCVIIVILILLYWLHSYACIICLYIFYCWDLFLWMIWAAEQQWDGTELDCYFAKGLQRISKFCILTFRDCFIALSPPPLTFTATLRSEKLSAFWDCKKILFWC